MYFVYLLESEHDPARRYVGSTGDLRQRPQEHNAGKSKHTAKYVPRNKDLRCDCGPSESRGI